MKSEEKIVTYKLIKLFNYLNINNNIEKKIDKFLSSLENPNGLDLAKEIEIITEWVKKNPAKSRWWKQNPEERIQQWIRRTVRNKPFEYPEPKIKTSSELTEKVKTIKGDKLEDLYQAMNCQKPCKLHCSQSCVDVKNCDWQNQINTFLNLYKLNKFSALLMNRIERYDEGLSAVIGLHEKGLLYLKEKDNEF